MNKLINTDAHEIRDGERRFKIRPCLTAKDNPQTVARSLLLSPIPWLCISNAMWYEMKSHDEIPMTKIPIPRQRGPPTNRSAPFSGWVQLRPPGPTPVPSPGARQWDKCKPTTALDCIQDPVATSNTQCEPLLFPSRSRVPIISKRPNGPATSHPQLPNYPTALVAPRCATTPSISTSRRRPPLPTS